MTKHCPNPDCPGLARDGAVGEFVDALEACLDCGGGLMRGAAPRDAPECPEFSDLETVFIAGDLVQGHLVRGRIEAEGIRAYVKGEPLVGALGELPRDVVAVEVQVAAEDREAARAIALIFEGARSRSD